MGIDLGAVKGLTCVAEALNRCLMNTLSPPAAGVADALSALSRGYEHSVPAVEMS